MKYSYTSLVVAAAAAAVMASPVPDGSKPTAIVPIIVCDNHYNGSFTFVVDPIEDGNHKLARQVSQIADGQIQAPTSAPSTSVSKSKSSSSSSSDASQSKSSGSSSSGASQSKSSSASSGPPSQYQSNGQSSSQPPSSESKSSSNTSPRPTVTQIADGQIQAPPDQPKTSSSSASSLSSSVSSASTHSSSASKSSPASSAGSSASTSSTSASKSSSNSASSSSTSMRPPVSQIPDGQIQAPTDSPSSSSPLTMKTPASQIPDGQVQAPPSSSSQSSSSSKPSTSVKTINTTTTSKTTTHLTKTVTTTKSVTTTHTGNVVSIQSDGQITAPTGKLQERAIGACDKDGGLTMTLEGGILKDGHGRQGYIAGNGQLQFDKPPQDGALATEGFSVCPGGHLALRTNDVFYECLSGDFYNVYDRDIAPQCRPVHLLVASLVKC